MLRQIYNKEHKYQVILCKPDKTEIAELSYLDLEYSPRFRGVNELKLTISAYIEGWEQKKNPYFDLLMTDSVILLNKKINDDIISQEYFVVDDISENFIEKDSKDVVCRSLHYKFNRKKIRGYKDVRRLYTGEPYDFEINTTSGILDYIIQYKLSNSWDVGFIAPELVDIYRTFDISETTVLSLFTDLENMFGCIFEFDSVQNLINIRLPKDVGENKSLVLAKENYLKNIQVSIDPKEAKTRIYPKGSNGIGITRYTVSGQNYIDNLWYFRNSLYMSNALLEALDNYDQVLADNMDTFDSLLTQLEGYESQLLTKQNELNALNTQLLFYQDNENTCQEDDGTAEGEDYSFWYDAEQDQLDLITSKKAEINSINTQITSVKSQIITLNDTVSYESNFSSELLKELNEFINEETLNVDNISDEKTLYEYTLSYINKNCQPSINIELDVISILDTNEAYLDWQKINLADYVNIDYDKLNEKYSIIASLPAYKEDVENGNYSNTLRYDVGMAYTEDIIGTNPIIEDYVVMRICEYTHSPTNNTLKIKLSNKTELNNDGLYVNSIIKKSAELSTTANNERDDYKSYTKDKDSLLTNTSVIDTSKNEIKINDRNVINQRGYIGKNITGNGHAIKIAGDKIIITNDSYASYQVLLSGNGLQLESQNGKSRFLVTPDYGIQIDKKVSGVWDNVFYVDTNGNVILDGGYLQLLTEDNMKQIKINPILGIEIDINIGTVSSPIWDKRFWVNTDGNLIAKQLRTSSSSNDYLQLEEQYIDFWNSGLRKMRMGFTEISGIEMPYIAFGAGDSNGRNIATFLKSDIAFSIAHLTSNNNQNRIDFYNGNVYDYDENGAISFTGIVDFRDADIKNTASGNFETADGKLVVVSNGLISQIIEP